MARLIMWNLITLDGLFEGAAKWDLHHHDYVWGDELEQFSIEQASEAGAVLFGRLTYDGMAAYWSSATGRVADIMNSIPKVVFSNTLPSADWNNTRLVRRRAEEEVGELRRRPGKDLLVFGSAELCDGLLRADLFDEIRLCIVPVVLGEGTPLFKRGPERRMELLQVRGLRSGAAIHSYRVAADRPPSSSPSIPIRDA
jgi:dihydrofolate reductase